MCRPFPQPANTGHRYSPDVLVIEDDHSLARVIVACLQRAGLRVRVACSAEEAALTVGMRLPDLMLLDLVLPDQPGESLLERLAQAGLHVPTVVVTSRNDIATKRRLFGLGAHDYLTKPFELEEFLVRVCARAEPQLSAGLIVRGGILLDLKRSRATCGAQVVELAPKSSALLALLLTHMGEVIEWPTIRGALWGYADDVRSNTHHVHVLRMRRVLRALRAPVRLSTLNTVGILLEEVSHSRPDE